MPSAQALTRTHRCKSSSPVKGWRHARAAIAFLIASRPHWREKLSAIVAYVAASATDEGKAPAQPRAEKNPGAPISLRDTLAIALNGPLVPYGRACDFRIACGSAPGKRRRRLETRSGDGSHAPDASGRMRIRTARTARPSHTGYDATGSAREGSVNSSRRRPHARRTIQLVDRSACVRLHGQPPSQGAKYSMSIRQFTTTTWPEGFGSNGTPLHDADRRSIFGRVEGTSSSNHSPAMQSRQSQQRVERKLQSERKL